MNKELAFLRTFAIVTVVGIFFIATTAFNKNERVKFNEIDVERINIVEKDGTVKMILTNVGRFPNGKEKINKLPTNEERKKRSGMLFFNEDGIECGGFIYDGKKMPNGHNAGLSLTYDQYDGDQVMQLLTQDYKEGANRFVSSGLMFNDRPSNESQQKMAGLMKELDELGKKDPKAADAKYQEYVKQGLLGGAPRLMLGKSRSENNGLFLFDDKGMPKAMFYVDKQNNAKLDFFDEKGNIIASFPEKKP
ncbi:MAG: hypothetical protein ACOVNY_07865 [Chitinophagaceae bacterium]